MTTQEEPRVTLLPCPFCGSRPHHGLGKVEHCQLHGEPFQRFNVWCPRGCAKMNGMTEGIAKEMWNTRQVTEAAALLGREVELRSALVEMFAAMRRYESEVDPECPVPTKHRDMMLRVEALLGLTGDEAPFDPPDDVWGDPA